MKLVLLEDLAAGCLTNPYGGYRRRVWYLEELVGDIIEQGVTLCWCWLPHGRRAYCDHAEKVIYLSPSLFTRGPMRVRWAICHELTHLRHGTTDDEWVHGQQWLRYQRILFPEYLAV